MKIHFSIYLCVALLPSIIYCQKPLQQCANDVVEIAKNGGLIEGIFQPLGDKPLGIGAFSFVYRGILIPIKIEIAMKFSRPENFFEAQEEYQMYSYLEAINDTNIERYGIPVVYYHGEWTEKNISMIGITLLEKDVQELVNSKEIYKHEVNFLILIRDFILASKYMHSHAIRHDDIKPSNIMIRKHRIFLIDFNISSPMNERSHSGTATYISRRGHENGERYPKDDWESFLYSICATLDVQLPWLDKRSLDEIQALKQNTTATIKLIEKIESETLRNILVPFAKHVFDDGGELKSEGIETLTFYHVDNEKRFPDYNYWYKLVDEKIQESNLPKPVLFTWLTKKQKEEAIADLNEHPIPDITKIDEPKDYDYYIMSYPHVDRQKFIRAYTGWAASSSQSFVSSKSFTGSKNPSKKSGAMSKSKSKGSSSSSAHYYTCSDLSTPRK